ncbi:hypothetical protein [uncultured Acinetobacter sp.]|uniref:hypothetical protein n=1 Tax=uncultured Acinetobacter sp. TaxID=165433 RepID=UPI00263268D0|nr:hypothetical protein [uncultured Acinetobacter sp.]
MNILNQVSTKIAALKSGDQWVVTAKDLWISRADFQSLAVYLARQASEGDFSINDMQQRSAWLDQASLTVLKH